MKYKVVGLSVELTRRCNLACAHCGRGEAQDATISEEVIDRLIEDVQDVGILRLYGGEPLLVPEKIEYMVQKINNSNWTTATIELTTNGTILNSKIIDIYETFCMGQQGRIAYLRISNDPFHDAKNAEQARAFYTPLIEAANERLDKSGNTGKIYVRYANKSGLKDTQIKLTYIGRAVELIESGKQLPRNAFNVDFPDPYGHRLRIDGGDTIRCAIELCPNGDISFDEMLDWETLDRIAFGNIMEDHFTDIVNRHNQQCMILCSETEKLKRAEYGKYYVDEWKQWPLSVFQARELLYKRILELRHKARELFPNVSASRIIETLPFPTDYENEMNIFEVIYKGSDFYNEDLLKVFYEFEMTPKYYARFNAIFQAIILHLKDKKKRKKPYYFLGNDDDILKSLAFQKLNYLNNHPNTLEDNSRNFYCTLLENEDLSYGKITGDETSGWNEEKIISDTRKHIEERE